MLKRSVFALALASALVFPCLKMKGQGVFPTFEDVAVGFAEDAAEYAKTRALSMECTANFGLSSNFTWAGTRPMSINTNSSFKFNVLFDGKTNNRETYIRVFHVAGGFQSDFTNDVNDAAIEAIAGSPSNLADVLLESATQTFENAINTSITPVEVFDWWDCEAENNECHYDKLAASKGTPNNSATRSCRDRSFKNPGALYPFCEGRYGIFKVDILNRRRRARGCRRWYEPERRCFYFIILPDLPPGLVNDPKVVETRYTCANNNQTNLTVAKTDGFSRVCWSMVDNNFNNKDLGCDIGNSIYVNYTDGKKWTAQYIKDYENGCKKEIRGLSKTFMVLPISSIEPPVTENSLTVGCFEIFPLSYGETELNPRPGVEREVRWYETREDRSEPPFFIGNSLPDTIKESVTYFVKVVDKVDECESEISVLDREPVSAIVLGDIFPDLITNNVLKPEFEEIFDNREVTTINCLENSKYHVVLEKHNDLLIDDLLDNSEEFQDIRNFHGNSIIRTNSPGLTWYRIEDDGTETPFSPNNHIYTEDGDVYKVCASNTGLEMYDYDTEVRYRARFEVNVDISDQKGFIQNENCKRIQGFFDKVISLKPTTGIECTEAIGIIRGQLPLTGELSDCDEVEYVKKCPSTFDKTEIGLENYQIIELINETHPQVVNLNNVTFNDITHQWNEVRGLKNPDQTRTELIYNDIPGIDHEYFIYKLDLNQTIEYQTGTPTGPISDRIVTHTKYCAVTYKCPNCE